MGEDINQVSPTLGFNIKTLFHNGFSLHICKFGRCSYVAKLIRP